MPISVTCESCFSVFRVPDKAAGKRFLCKECGDPIQVPLPGEDFEEEYEDVEIEAPVRRTRGKKPSVNDDSKLMEWGRTFSERYDDSTMTTLWLWTIGSLVGTILVPITLVLTLRQIADARNCQHWPVADATITKTDIERKHQRYTGLVYIPRAEYTFQVDDNNFSGGRIAYDRYDALNKAEAEQVIKKYRVGTTHKAHYKPSDPSQSVLETEFQSTSYLILLIPVIFMLSIPNLFLNGLALYYRLNTQ